VHNFNAIKRNAPLCPRPLTEGVMSSRRVKVRRPTIAKESQDENFKTTMAAPLAAAST